MDEDKRILAEVLEIASMILQNKTLYISKGATALSISGDAETARKISESLPDLLTSIRILREHSKILRDAK